MELITYIAIALTFLLLDALWLGMVAKNFYRSRLDSLLRQKPYVFAAAVFYALYTVGILLFTVLPLGKYGVWWQALGLGAVFGLIAYATYDLTNLSTLKKWPKSVTILDIFWGTFITAVTALVGFLVHSLL